MATTTPNLGLVLPDGTENVSRQVINNNNSIIDANVGDKIIAPSVAFEIPQNTGDSATYTMSGITANHILMSWNFSVSAENSPPVDLQWETFEGYFTITNLDGTTDETIRPVFAIAMPRLATEQGEGE